MRRGNDAETLGESKATADEDCDSEEAAAAAAERMAIITVDESVGADSNAADEWVELLLPPENGDGDDAAVDDEDRQKLYYNRRTGRAQLHPPNKSGVLTSGNSGAGEGAGASLCMEQIRVQKGGTKTRPTWHADGQEILIDAAIM